MDQTEKLPAKCIAVFGTGSDVGKSIVATALCRYFFSLGIKVAPFKAQNMSNNSGVTAEGLEMGRAQIVQAEAAGVLPHVDMNPVLLKPTSDLGSQVVVLGKVFENSTALEYHKKKEVLFKTAVDALDRLREKYDVVVIEGAGSCAEVNLMAHDIVNFKIAEYAKAPVVLVSDIHRGGVFAQIIGTLACLPEKYQKMIAGFIVNRFRGDLRLFKDGVDYIVDKTEKTVFGVLPWFNDIKIQDEDSVAVEKASLKNNGFKGEKRAFKGHGNGFDVPSIAIIRLPHISNFTDFDTLFGLSGVDVFFTENHQDLSSCTCVIIPGSKNTRADLCWMFENGFSDAVKSCAERGSAVLGICGGFQMLGSDLNDPEGFEGEPGSTQGLGLLPVSTFMKNPKTTTFSMFSFDGARGCGYEIHMGRTVRNGGHAMLEIHERNHSQCDDEDGCISHEGNVFGTYLHGFFDDPDVLKAFLSRIGAGHVHVHGKGGLAARELEYDRLLEHVKTHVNLSAIKGYIDI